MRKIIVLALIALLTSCSYKQDIDCEFYTQISDDSNYEVLYVETMSFGTPSEDEKQYMLSKFANYDYIGYNNGNVILVRKVVK